MTRISTTVGNTDAFETTASITVDVGAAQSGRKLLGFVGQVTDATDRITAASQITLGGSSTGVTLAGTSTAPDGQPAAICKRFTIDIPAALAGNQTLTVDAGAASAARKLFLLADVHSSAGTISVQAYGSNTFNNNPTITMAGSATGEEAVLFVMCVTSGVTLTPGTGSSTPTGGSGGTNLTLWALRENGAANVVVDGTWSGSQEYCCAGFSLATAAGPSATNDPPEQAVGNPRNRPGRGPLSSGSFFVGAFPLWQPVVAVDGGAAGVTVSATTSMLAGAAGGGAAGQVLGVAGSLIAGGAGGGAPGQTVAPQASLIAGAASGQQNPTAAGATITTTASLIGAGAGGGAAGVTLAPTASLIAGAATGGASAAGQTITATANVIGGGAGGGAAGATIAPAASLVSGAATGGASAAGATVAPQVTLVVAGAGGGAGGALVAPTVALIAGGASAGGPGTAAGTTVSATASLVGGAAVGQRQPTAPGVVIVPTAAFLAGAASGNADGTAGGVVISITAALVAGGALGPTLGSTPGYRARATTAYIARAEREQRRAAA